MPNSPPACSQRQLCTFSLDTSRPALLFDLPANPAIRRPRSPVSPPLDAAPSLLPATSRVAPSSLGSTPVLIRKSFHATYFHVDRLGIGCVLIASPIAAATFNWTSNIGGTFNVATNWTPNVIPSSADTVIFSVNSAYTVSFNTANTVVNTFTLDRGDVTLDMNTNTFRASNLTSSSMGNTVHTASLRITDGVFRPGNLYRRSRHGAVSNLILDTASNTTIGTGPFLVGLAGTGNLTLQNGAPCRLPAAPDLASMPAASATRQSPESTTASTWTIERRAASNR